MYCEQTIIQIFLFKKNYENIKKKKKKHFVRKYMGHNETLLQSVTRKRKEKQKKRGKRLKNTTGRLTVPPTILPSGYQALSSNQLRNS